MINSRIARVVNSRRRTAMILALFVLLASNLHGFAVSAQGTPVAQSDEFKDSAGRFTAPIPNNWTVVESNGVAVFTDPDNEISVFLAVAPGPEATNAVLETWRDVEPDGDFTYELSAVTPAPSQEPFEETVVVTLDDGSVTGQFRQGFGQRIENQTYVMIVVGSLDAIIKRNSQILIIASGFAPTNIAETDLSRIDPLPFGDRVQREFELFIHRMLAQFEIPGASVVVVQDGKIVYAEGFGVTQAEGGNPVTPNTRMMIGSTTKSMTTLMMATGVDDDTFDWSTPAIELYPDFAVADPELSQTITLQNMVCACTGVPRRDLEFLFNADDLDAVGVIESLRDFEFYTDFGEAFQYSNQMVASAGYIVSGELAGSDQVLEQAYVEQMQKRMFDPIAMSRSTFSFEEVAADADHATPHGATITGELEPLPLTDEATLLPIMPAGAAWSTANDLGLYLLTELGNGVAPNGTRVVSEANLLERRTPQVLVDAETSYGLGWFVGSYKGVQLIAHGGNTLGFTSDFAFMPEKGLGIAILANAQSQTIAVESIRTKLFELLFQQPSEVDDLVQMHLDALGPAIAAAEQAVHDSIEPRFAAQLVGTWVSDELGEVEITPLSDGNLLMDAGEFDVKIVQATVPETGEEVLVTSDSPIPGLVLTPSDDKMELNPGLAADVYVFERVVDRDPATSVATPAA